MLKRLIAVVLVKQGLAVQSFGYQKYLPLGKPEIIVKNLDRWMVDEIAVISIDNSHHKGEPDYKTLEKIMSQKITTPLIFGGGIRSSIHAKTLIQLGADRIIIESLFHDRRKDILEEISESIGNQALIRSCPLIIHNKDIKMFVPRTNTITNFDHDFENSINDLYSEILIIDKNSEGYSDKFDQKLLELPSPKKQKIAFGGIASESTFSKIINRKDVAAVAIGNFLNYRELSNLEYANNETKQVSRLVDFGKKSLGEKEW